MFAYDILCFCMFCMRHACICGVYGAFCTVMHAKLCGGGGGVDPIPCVSTHRISDPR